MHGRELRAWVGSFRVHVATRPACNLTCARSGLCLQMCDFTGEEIAQLVHEDLAGDASGAPPHCHERTGWYTQETVDTMRKLLKSSLAQLAAGKGAGPARPAAAQPPLPGAPPAGPLSSRISAKASAGGPLADVGGSDLMAHTCPNVGAEDASPAHPTVASVTDDTNAPTHHTVCEDREAAVGDAGRVAEHGGQRASVGVPATAAVLGSAAGGVTAFGIFGDDVHEMFDEDSDAEGDLQKAEEEEEEDDDDDDDDAQEHEEEDDELREQGGALKAASGVKRRRDANGMMEEEAGGTEEDGDDDDDDDDDDDGDFDDDFGYEDNEEHVDEYDDDDNDDDDDDDDEPSLMFRGQ